MTKVFTIPRIQYGLKGNRETKRLQGLCYSSPLVAAQPLPLVGGGPSTLKKNAPIFGGIGIL